MNLTKILLFDRINSTIIANTAKNKKKAEKKKRALERRVSEGDAAGSFEVLNKLPASSSMDLSMMNEGKYLTVHVAVHCCLNYFRVSRLGGG